MPRPMMRAERAATNGATISRPIGSHRRAQRVRQLRHRIAERAIARPVRQHRQPRRHRGDAGLGGGDALLGAGLQRNGEIGHLRRRRVRVVDDGDDLGAALLRGLRHRQQVGAAAGLRDHQHDRALQAQRRLVDRGDRRPDRHHRQAELGLGRVFEEGRGVIGGAARADRDQARIDIAQQLAGGADRIARLVQQPRHRIAGFGGLARHPGGAVGGGVHECPPPLSCSVVSSTTKS